jgi:formamidopyrimidine-DNA glycosylase
MPELPEVETLKRELARVLVGKKLKDTGQKITGVERRAKVLMWHLSGGATILIHLKMTGQLVYIPASTPASPNRGERQGGPLAGKQIIGGHPEDPTRHTRHIFYFSDGSRLLFNDLRKFGWIKTVPKTELPSIFKNTGPEPLEREFTLAKFKERLLSSPKRNLKALLLDQTVIAGLGNIYVDESCFRAGVKPTRVVGSLNEGEVAKLYQAIRAVLKLAIQKKGTSARNYVRSSGQPGGFVPYLNVYGRQGEKCKKCSTSIEKIKLAGRGTHFCPICQK